MGMGGSERVMEEPFHTERAQSTRVAFIAAAPSRILGLRR